jgi:hypothetical protein
MSAITSQDPVDHLYYSQRRISEGTRNAQELGICSLDETNCRILTISTIAGTVIGTCVSPGPGTFAGALVGFGTGLTIVITKEMLK